MPNANSDHSKRWGRQIVNRASQEDAIALYHTASGVDLRKELPRITQPTLIIHGEADVIVLVAAVQLLAQRLPNAKFITLPDAGHVPTLTHAQVIAQEITSFFPLPLMIG